MFSRKTLSITLAICLTVPSAAAWGAHEKVADWISNPGGDFVLLGENRIGDAADAVMERLKERFGPACQAISNESASCGRVADNPNVWLKFDGKRKLIKYDVVASGHDAKAQGLAEFNRRLAEAKKLFGPRFSCRDSGKNTVCQTSGRTTRLQITLIRKGSWSAVSYTILPK